MIKSRAIIALITKSKGSRREGEYCIIEAERRLPCRGYFCTVIEIRESASEIVIRDAS